MRDEPRDQEPGQRSRRVFAGPGLEPQGASQGAWRLAALGALAPGITPERAATAIAMMTSPASWRQLTQRSGWSFDEAETWLTASLTRLLLANSR